MPAKIVVVIISTHWASVIYGANHPWSAIASTHSWRWMEFYIYTLAREEQFFNRMRYVTILVFILLVGCGDPTPVAAIPTTPEE